MRFCLPKIVLPSKIITSLTVFVFLLSVIFLSSIVSSNVYAQGQTGVTPTPVTNDGSWREDEEVTFVGKTGARAGEFLDWALENYSWLCVVKVDENTCDNSNNPLIPFWEIIRNIVYAVVALFVLATAFILIITRGQNLTVMRFIPRFVFVIVFITLSFSLVQFIYQIADIVQGFFLRIDPGRDNPFITTRDLLYVGFDYKSFTGFRREGLSNDESAFISLLLVRLTAITYYVMTGVLIVRKIILWFFIVISPIFPLLIFYRPIRNTAKIWVGEFFRWLLYGPLFAVFLHGLVIVWRAGIPLPFDTSAAGDQSLIVYPTAINILLGGPGQTIGIHNSVNFADTFALYVVALIMLWVVILLPWLLLRIFLDYLFSLSIGSGGYMFKQVANKSLNLFNQKTPPPPPSTPPPPPGKFMPAGMARSLPFMKGRGAAVKPVEVRSTVQASVTESKEVLKLANLSIPKMRDIAKYETSMLSSDINKRNEVNQFHATLKNIANPNTVVVPGEKEKFSTVREKLMEQKQKGNPIAASVLNASQISTTNIGISHSQQEEISHSIVSSILNASNISTNVQNITQNKTQYVNNLRHTLTNIASPEKNTNTTEKEKYTNLKDQLLKEKAKGNKVAESILDTSEGIEKVDVAEEVKKKQQEELLDKLLEEQKRERGSLIAPAGPKPRTQHSLPTVNKVQQVSLEEYEEVRKLWTENYQSIEPPQDLSGKEVTRREWIKGDIDKITNAITLMNSQDEEKVQEGMSMVANILPFLMIGGFSKSEVVAYLKAKQEAGKSVLADIERKEEEEDTMLGARKTTEGEEQKEMTRAAEIEEKPKEVENVPTLEDSQNARTTEDIKPDSGNNNGDTSK